MKIKVYSRFANLGNQGQGRVTVDVINSLRNLGNEVIINETKLKSNYGYLFHALLGKAIDIRKADINIALSSMDSFYLDPSKSIVFVCDLIPLLHQFTVLTHYSGSPFNQIGSLSFFYLTLRQAIKFKVIICISHQTKRELLQVFPQLDSNKIKVIGCQIQDKYKPQKRNNNIKLRLYTVSALDNRKRTLELIKWFNKWNPKNIELVIGGSGALLDEAKRIANKNVTILGKVPENEMLQRYKECDIFLFPTKSEGFGIPIIEACKCKRPVITLKDANIPEEVKTCSIIAESFNDMKRLILNLKNNKTYKYIVDDKYNLAEKFNINYGQKIEGLINEYF